MKGTCGPEESPHPLAPNGGAQDKHKTNNNLFVSFSQKKEKPANADF